VPSIPTITVPTWPTAAQRLAELLKVAGFALAVMAIEAILAHGVVGPQISRFVFLFVGLFAVAFVFRFPMATALVLLGLTDFIFFPTFFAYQVGPLSIRPHELALAGLLVVAALRPAKRTWGGTSGAALAIFLAMVVLSAALAVAGGRASLTDAFNWARPLALLTFFYVVVRLFPAVEQRRVLLTGAAVLAAVTGVIALMVALGAGFSHALQEAGGNTVTQEEGFGQVERVRLAGLSAGYALFWFTVVQIVSKRGTPRTLWSFLLAGIALDIVVSFNRNMWLGIVIGLVLMAIVGGSMVRNRLAVAVAVAVASITLFVTFGTSSTNSHVVEPILQRGETLFNPSKTSQESSLQDRARETDKAWEAAQHHLLLGVGAGAGFGVLSNVPISSGSFIIGFTQTPQLFLHNQYLYLLLISGIPGLIAFLVFLGVPLAHSVRRRPRDPPITALGVGLALIMISSVVAIYFTVEDMTAVLGLLTGVIMADFESRAADGRSSGLIGPTGDGQPAAGG
jgi:O-antigen ligase